jgi:hypothetical protein
MNGNRIDFDSRRCRLNKVQPKIHLTAGILFATMAMLVALLTRSSRDGRWRVFSLLSIWAAGLAWTLFMRAYRRRSGGRRNSFSAYPEGHARLIEAGRLPNRYNPHIELREYEICHFSVGARRLRFADPPADQDVDPTQLMVRFSGGSYYFIARPHGVLLPAELDHEIYGEFVITSQRVMFVAPENGFEVPLQSLKLLDCSAHLVDFQVRGRRYTIQTEAASLAEKVLLMLLQPSAI